MLELCPAGCGLCFWQALASSYGLAGPGFLETMLWQALIWAAFRWPLCTWRRFRRTN